MNASKTKRWRLRLDIHINVTDGESIDDALAEAADQIEKALAHRAAVAGKFDLRRHDVLPRREAKR